MSSALKTRGFVQTSVGKKIVMAITGFLLLGFVIAHMLGNLQIFLGPEKLNAYAKALKDLGPLLWVARIGLLATFAAHLGCAILLVLENNAARPVPYQVHASQISSFASRTMKWSGIIILLFLLYHLAHYTFGVTNPEYLDLKDSLGRHDVYAMVVAGYKNPIISITYVFAMAALCLHLSHGFFSVFQTIGVNHPNREELFRKASNGLALLIFVGNSSMPLSVLLGLIK
ncbi:MAG: succinate dehydrogenase cytochrome b subunit [Leptospiraceae bacterium]|nr:succinate dehydrogenase cytochrome b subunit [Leptospiraceae bacterium]